MIDDTLFLYYTDRYQITIIYSRIADLLRNPQLSRHNFERPTDSDNATCPLKWLRFHPNSKVKLPKAHTFPYLSVFPIRHQWSQKFYTIVVAL